MANLPVDKLESLTHRYAELEELLCQPHVLSDAKAYTQLSRERAELTGVDIGWRLDAEGLRFGPLRETGWEPLGADLGDELRQRDWPPGTALALWREGEPLEPAVDPAQPQLACLASGELSPFVLELRREGVAGGWRLRGELLGTLALEPLDAP